MTPQVDSWTIVLPGSWNPAIFRPDWITSRLTRAKEISVEVAFGGTIELPRFRFDGVHLRVAPKRLILGVDEASDASLTRLEDIAVRALRDLPHTPIGGAGVNFGFLEEDPSPELIELFGFIDTGRLADVGFTVRSSTLRRNLRFDDGRELNLTLELRSDAALSIDANFHREVSNSEEAVAYLEGHVVELKDRILELLDNAYELGVS